MIEPRRVLVVEDEETIREVLVIALEDDGYSVRDVGDGRRALEVVVEWQPHIILLDLMLPVLDGWAFLREATARQLLDRVPVIVVSASRRGMPDAESYPSCAAVIAKPFDLTLLLETIANLVNV